MTAPQIPEFSAFIPAICFGPDNQILEKPFMLKPCRHRVNASDLHKYEKACYCGSIVSKSKPDLELQGVISVCLQNRTVVDQLVRQVKSKDEEMVAYKAQVQPRLEKLEKLEKRALGALNLQPKPKALPAKTESELAKESIPQIPAESLKAAAPSIPNPLTPPYESLPSESKAIKVVESVPVAPQAMEVTPVEEPKAEVLEKTNQAPAVIPVAIEVIATANNPIPVITSATPAQPEASNISIKVTLKKPAKRASEETSVVPTEGEEQIPTISQQTLPLILPTFPKKPKAKAMAKANDTTSSEIAETDEASPLKKKWVHTFQGSSTSAKPKAAANVSSKADSIEERMPIPKKPAAPAIPSKATPKTQSPAHAISMYTPTPVKPSINVITFAPPAAPKAPASATRVHTTIDMTGTIAKPALAVPVPSAPAQPAPCKQMIQAQVSSEVQAYFGSPLPQLAPKDTPQGTEQRKPLVSEVDAVLAKILASKEAAKSSSATPDKKQSL
jgi:hypothetical protein